MNGWPLRAAAAPSGRTLYVTVGERIASYALDASGALTFSQEAETGTNVDAIAVSPSGSVVYVAHCSENGGSISVIPIPGDHRFTAQLVGALRATDLQGAIGDAEGAGGALEVAGGVLDGDLDGKLA